jgi:hypothetical protein
LLTHICSCRQNTKENNLRIHQLWWRN